MTQKQLFRALDAFYILANVIVLALVILAPGLFWLGGYSEVYFSLRAGFIIFELIYISKLVKELFKAYYNM